MNYIFALLVLISIFFGIINNTLNDVIDSIWLGCKKTLDISLYLIGIMAFWLGVLNIAKKSGLLSLFSKIVTPIIDKIFDELPEKSEIQGNIALNFSANFLGLANAATPFGIAAIKKMQDINVDKTSASNSMCMLLAMNTAGFQLIPATIIAILAANGFKNPQVIILPTFIVTFIAFVSSIIFSKVMQKIYKKQQINENIIKQYDNSEVKKYGIN